MGKNNVIRQNDVIFNIEIRVHGLANGFPKVFLLITRFKSYFKSVKCSEITGFVENRQYYVIMWPLLGQNDAIRQIDVIFFDQFFCKSYPVSISNFLQNFVTQEFTGFKQLNF